MRSNPSPQPVILSKICSLGMGFVACDSVCLCRKTASDMLGYGSTCRPGYGSTCYFHVWITVPIPYILTLTPAIFTVSNNSFPPFHRIDHLSPSEF
eukprot:scaffold9897_cov68-Cylindrotheca_fusiformis.AAC.1